MIGPAEDKKSPLLVVIAGPTASGKTAVAIELARYFDTSILSADSRQCYKELDIGVARPTPAELEAVQHYFIASHSIHQPVDAAAYATFGLSVLENIFREKNIAIAAGGTGLYLKALCEGVDEIPKVPDEIRAEVISLYQATGLEGLRRKLEERDPLYAADGEMANPQRVMRALEVSLFTGNSIRNYQKGKSTDRTFRVLYFGMDWKREVLHQQINRRVEQMMQAGLLEEVTSLRAFRHLNALQTVGYTELFDYLDGKTSLAEAIELIKTHTRQYAKRQVTWFKKIPGMQWVAPGALDEMKARIEENLST